MDVRMYLGEAFGWETDSTAKVAIFQLRAEGRISREKCPKAQLINNLAYRALNTLIKVFD